MGRKVVLVLASLIMFGMSVAFANTIDLTSAPLTKTAGDGSIWSVVIGQPTGTGVYEPFLRFQANGTEAGLNTDGPANLTYNDVGGIWTHSVLWSSLALVQKDGKSYYTFTFDINEPASGGDAAKRFLSFDTLKLYSGAVPDATSTAGLTLNYNFSASPSQGPPVLLDYTLASSGSGKDDIEVLIPTSEVINPTGYMYLYIEAGGVGKVGGREYQSQDGFEEVRVLMGPSTVPEPASLLLLGVGLLGAGIFGRRRK